MWAREAADAFQRLRATDRAAILHALDLLRHFPEMFEAQAMGQWAGMRRFFSGPWVVFYAYWRPNETVYVEAIVPARAPDR